MISHQPIHRAEKERRGVEKPPEPPETQSSPVAPRSVGGDQHDTGRQGEAL